MVSLLDLKHFVNFFIVNFLFMSSAHFLLGCVLILFILSSFFIILVVLFINLILLVYKNYI